VTETTAEGEREVRPRAPGPLFEWVKRASFLELGIFGGLLFVWLIPGLEQPTFWFGLAHGIGYLMLCLILWIAIMKREAPFWLFAATLTPVGPVGSVIGIEWIERRGRAAPTSTEPETA
jgi:hypothetical protein